MFLFDNRNETVALRSSRLNGEEVTENSAAASLAGIDGDETSVLPESVRFAVADWKAWEGERELRINN